jgi:hypothetical protein
MASFLRKIKTREKLPLRHEPFNHHPQAFTASALNLK